MSFKQRDGVFFDGLSISLLTCLWQFSRLLQSFLANGIIQHYSVSTYAHSYAALMKFYFSLLDIFTSRVASPHKGVGDCLLLWALAYYQSAGQYVEIPLPKDVLIQLLVKPSSV